MFLLRASRFARMGPFGVALTGYELWRRLSPRQRQFVRDQAGAAVRQVRGRVAAARQSKGAQRPKLQKLRLSFADRPDYELAVESDGQKADPWVALRSLARDGRVPLGDRDSCAIEEVQDVRFVEPRPAEGPGWRGKLQDEDVATAVDENYEAPR